MHNCIKQVLSLATASSSGSLGAVCFFKEHSIHEIMQSLTSHHSGGGEGVSPVPSIISVDIPASVM
jgi:hypothetical protein